MPTLGDINMSKTYFYNVQTKSKVGVKLTKQNAKLKKTSNGRYMLQVTHNDTKMSRFVGSEDKKMLEKALGKNKSPPKRSRASRKKAQSRKKSKIRSACNKKKSNTCKKPCSWVKGSKGRKAYCRK